MTETLPQENTKDVATTKTYDDENPVYQRIKKEFTNKLKEKYDCEDYDKIVNYVFDFVFKKKLEKSKCIEKLDPYFNNKASDILNYLWTITKEAESEQKFYQNYNYKKGGKPYNKNYKQKYYKGKRERSRSDSRERGGNMYENNQNMPMQPKGYYPPKRFNGPPMMGMGAGYPPFFQAPQMMANFMRFKKKFPTKKTVSQTKLEGEAKNENAEENKDKVDPNQPGQKNEENPTDNKQTENPEAPKNLIDQEAFNKMTPEEQKDILAKRVATRKVRCKNWPNCKDPNCIYAHPTETCPHFPSCMYGDKCCYIHPNIPCKFGYYCTRIGCAYSHPAGVNPGMGMFPNMMRPVPFMKHKSKHTLTQEKNTNEKNESEKKEEDKKEGIPPQENQNKPEGENKIQE